MIIIPEIETILLQPPRTGTTSVMTEVLKKYPNAHHIYRHMEYAGIPIGYERWRTVAQVRDPYRRMESLFLYMKNPEKRGATDSRWLNLIKRSTEKGFKHWLLEDETIFNDPGPRHEKKFRPKYMCLYRSREQIKSQELWAGKANFWIRFDAIIEDSKRYLGIDLSCHYGKTNPEDRKWLNWTDSMFDHMKMYHAWDIANIGKFDGKI